MTENLWLVLDAGTWEGHALVIGEWVFEKNIALKDCLKSRGFWRKTLILRLSTHVKYD